MAGAALTGAGRVGAVATAGGLGFRAHRKRCRSSGGRSVGRGIACPCAVCGSGARGRRSSGAVKNGGQEADEFRPASVGPETLSGRRAGGGVARSDDRRLGIAGDGEHERQLRKSSADRAARTQFTWKRAWPKTGRARWPGPERHIRRCNRRGRRTRRSLSLRPVAAASVGEPDRAAGSYDPGPNLVCARCWPSPSRPGTMKRASDMLSRLDR